MNLTSGQQTVLDSRCHLLVKGGPGSGKTTIGLLKAKAVATSLLGEQTVLFLSFSNSAVYQIEQAASLAMTRDERRLISVDTFHRLCWNMLRSHGQIIGLPRPLSIIPPEDERAERSVDKNWDARRDHIARSTGQVAFDLFAPLAAELLRSCDRVRRIFASCHPLIIADEFQDTNDAEWNVIDLLTRDTQFIALADPNQRIYDFRPGENEQRLEQFIDARHPVIVDLQDENHRSRESDLLRYSLHVLEPERGKCASSAVTVSTYDYPNQAGYAVKRAVHCAVEAAKWKTGSRPVSVAIMGAVNKTALDVSEWLGKKTKAAPFIFRHEVFADSDELVSAWHVVMAVLDDQTDAISERVGNTLARMAALYRCMNTQGGRSSAEMLLKWCRDLRDGTWPTKSKLPLAIRAIVEHLQSGSISGCPETDCKNIIEQIQAVGTHGQAVAERCQRRNLVGPHEPAYDALVKLFEINGSYAGAQDAFRRAMVQDRLFDRIRPTRGCAVTTMHKCKGKEYDAVVIFDGVGAPHRLILNRDEAPFARSRKLLRVAITRARHHVCIVTPKNDRSVLLP